MRVSKALLSQLIVMFILCKYFNGQIVKNVVSFVESKRESKEEHCIQQFLASDHNQYLCYKKV